MYRFSTNVWCVDNISSKSNGFICSRHLQIYLTYISKIWLNFDCLWVTGERIALIKLTISQIFFLLNQSGTYIVTEYLEFVHSHCFMNIFCKVCNFKCSTTLSRNLCSLKYLLCLHITPKIFIRSSRCCVVLPASVLIEVLLALVDVPTLSGMTHDV